MATASGAPLIPAQPPSAPGSHAFQNKAQEAQVRAAIDDLLCATDIAQVSLGDFRASVATRVGLDSDGLDQDADLVNQWIKDAVARTFGTPPQSP